jgi:hypothetical protein
MNEKIVETFEETPLKPVEHVTKISSIGITKKNKSQSKKARKQSKASRRINRGK